MSATEVKTYKQLLLTALELRKQGGKSAYKRAMILVAVFNDQDFRLDNGNIDDDKIYQILDDYVEDLALNFIELKHLVEYFPKESQWAEGRLCRMYDQLLDSVPPQERTIISRKCATVAEVNHLKAEIRRLKAENTRLRQDLKAAQDVLAKYKKKVLV
jgi:hypothetical protein